MNVIYDVSTNLKCQNESNFGPKFFILLLSCLYICYYLND